MDDEEPTTYYRKWLEDFGNKINALGPEDDQTPFRLTSSTLVPLEFEGECLEWTRRYLSLHECPNGLVYQLSRAVFNSVKGSINISRFIIDSGDDGDRDEDEDEISDNASQESSDETDGRQNLPAQQISAGKLLIEVINHIHKVVKAWNQDPPNLVSPPTWLHVCSHAIKNTRRKMEDRHVIITDVNTLYDLKDCPTQSYFGVFDGHGGIEAADYAAAHLHNFLLSDVSFLSDPAVALKKAYKTTDLRFLEKAKRQGLRSGTTGVSALVRGEELHLAWLGDSQALLVRSGQPVLIMDPHKPEREDERQRIEELGGCVLFFGAWRVNGNIAVARAIGDPAHKPYISSDADVTSLHLTGEEEYLVLACDGLWDVLTPSQVTHTVYKHAHTSPGGLDDVAIGLVNAARNAGSSDNISVVVVLFKSKLSVPQSSIDGELLLGTSGPHEGNQDPSSSSNNGGSVPQPKPPTLNKRLESKSKGDAKEEYLSSTRGSSESLSPAIQQTPFTHKLMRQTNFYVNTPRVVNATQQRQRDANLIQMALRQAVSSADNKVRLSRKHKHQQEADELEIGGGGGMLRGNFARKKEWREVRRPKARSLSRQPNQSIRRGSSVVNLSKKKKNGGSNTNTSSFSLSLPAGLIATETQWGGHSDDSDDAWSVSTGLSEDWPPASSRRLPPGIAHPIGYHDSQSKKAGDQLNPIRLKGSSLLQAAISVEASTAASSSAAQWAKNMSSPFLHLAGNTLPLSSRATLPQILPCVPATPRLSNKLSGSHSNLTRHKDYNSSFSHHHAAIVPPLWGPGRQLSSLGDSDARSVCGDSGPPALGSRKLSVLSDTGLVRSSRHQRRRSGSFKDMNQALDTSRRSRPHYGNR